MFLWTAALLLVASPALALPPVVTNPGDQTNTEGDPVSLQIEASHPNPASLSYSATGLPARLEIDPGSGLISPAINDDDVAGSYPVTVTVSSGSDSSQIAFQWTILPAELGSGEIFREYWTGIAGSAVSDLTSAPAYPDAPSDSDFQTSLQMPSNWGDSHGTRLRGYIHPPLTGEYVFFIAADDTAELYLSSDDLPASASLIALVSAPTAPGQYDLLPGQESAPIPLVAGERYYIEVLHKENSGSDHLSVAWEIPGSPVAVIDGTYLSPLDFAPVFDPMVDHGGHVGRIVSFPVEATDPNGDPVSYSAIGLPAVLDVDPVSGMVSGTIDPGAAVGVYPVTVEAQDPGGLVGSADFDFAVVPKGSVLVVPMRRGVACQDDATGTGWLMYSLWDVRDRFWPDLPPSQNSTHFICVINVDGQWFYDNNDGYFPLEIWNFDVLVAEVDFDADTVTSLEGTIDTVHGVIAGYESGDLGFIPNEYNGVHSKGEFTVTGTHFFRTYYPRAPALPAWAQLLLPAALLVGGRFALRRRS
ncbi:MAG: putative Ig domain-containing protein [Thermoanaerobaculia bacterium]|nr:putative Ig domain-containing protein [Thermoanaerobaculia bacterium]